MKHDKSLLKRRFSRNLKTYDTLAVVQRAIAGRLGGLLSNTDPAAIRKGAEIGAGTGFLTRHLVRLFPETDWTLNDLVPESRNFLPGMTATGMPVHFSAGDGETFDFGEETYDLIASASAVQWFDDLPAFVGRAARGLRQSGILAFSTFGPENFREIAATTGQGLEYRSRGELARILAANGLHILAQEEWIERQCYLSPTDVLRHLRMTGVNAVAAERWTHSRLHRFEEDYRSAYGKTSENGGECVTLTFHPILIVTRKP